MKSYYRCSVCHKRVSFKYDKSRRTIDIICPDIPKIILNKKNIYKCVNYTWFERTYLSIRSVIRAIRNIK